MRAQQLLISPNGDRFHSVMEPLSVRIPDATKLTGLSRSRIYELIKSGDLETIKVGASTLVLVASLRTFIERRRSAS